MFVRLRRYRSWAEVREDLSRMRMPMPPMPDAPLPLALFIEGVGAEDASRRARDAGLTSSFSDMGHHPRACLLGGADDLPSGARALLGDDAAAKVIEAYRSNDAPSMAMPGGKLIFDRPLVMGILNLTPDSFSDGSSHTTVEASVLRALAMTEEGADIIDIGGESTRPGADPVSAEEELRRTIPVIKELAERTDVPISIDTMKPEVAREAVRAGAQMINDVSGLRSREMVEVVADTGAPVVLMHMFGEPKTMQKEVSEESYDDVISDIMWFWEQRMETAESLGLPRERILLDPGIGFGKLQEHNLDILRRTRELRCSGRPLLIGASRKGFVSRIAGDTAERRGGGSLAAAAVAALNGANVVRVHDVPETVGALRLLDALRSR